MIQHRNEPSDSRWSMSGLVLAILLVGIETTHRVEAEDWPTYMYDNSRSGVTSENLDWPKLQQVWVYESPSPPRTAFAGAAPWDSYHDEKHVQNIVMRTMRDFDSAFFVSVVGDSVFFGSSVTDSVHCLDIKSGKQKWSFTTDGPVRFPPSYDSDRLYFASDDGYAYCIHAQEGKLIWKYTPIKEQDHRLVGNNGKFIPMWPIRTGTAVESGNVYFAAALVPWRESYLCSVDASDGKENYRVSGGPTPMGAVLTSTNKVFLTQGRSFPSVYDRTDGRLLGNFTSTGFGGGQTNSGNANGGTYALITSEKSPQFIYGRGQSYGAEEHPQEPSRLRSFNASTREAIATHPSAIAMIVSEDHTFILSGLKLVSIDRPSGSVEWSCDSLGSASYTLVKAGDHLIVGGNGTVAAYSAHDGTELWRSEVTGRIRGLAVANGRLFASSDTGHIFTFGHDN